MPSPRAPAGSFAATPVTAPPALAPDAPAASSVQRAEWLARRAGLLFGFGLVLLPIGSFGMFLVYVLAIDRLSCEGGCPSALWTQNVVSIWPLYLVGGLVSGALLTATTLCLGFWTARASRRRRLEKREPELTKIHDLAKRVYADRGIEEAEYEHAAARIQRQREASAAQQQLLLGQGLLRTGVVLLPASFVVLGILTALGLIVEFDSAIGISFFAHLPGFALAFAFGVFAVIAGARSRRAGTQSDEREWSAILELERRLLEAARGTGARPSAKR